MIVRLRRTIFRTRSLRRQLIVGVTGVHMILMVSFVYDLVERQHSFLMDRARSRTLNQAGILAASAVPQIVTGDKAGLREIIQSFSRDRSIRTATVTDVSGRIWADSDWRKMGLYFDDDLSRRILSGEARPQIIHEGPTVIFAAAPIMISNSLRGWAWVGGDITDDHQQILEARTTGLVYALVAIICGALFAVALASGITKQLRLLLAGTRRLSEDRLDQPVPIVTENDVGVVAQAFNDAVARLEHARTQAAQARERLEAEVRERRRAEERLKAANRAITIANDNLRQFAYVASHDLQEPLRGVSGYAALLKKRYTGKLDADADEFITYISDGAERMQHLIKALLQYSRAASTDEQPHVVDCNTALAAALTNLEISLEETGAVIESETLPVVEAHDIAITQLFQNLIGNALKYSGERRPEIRLWAEACGSEWVFAVSDRGIGIAPEQHERIFRIFRRAHGDKYPGTGVGLAICAKIVDRYGGRIWVESEPGKGSTFRFSVPAALVTAPPQSPADSSLNLTVATAATQETHRSPQSH